MGGSSWRLNSRLARSASRSWRSRNMALVGAEVVCNNCETNLRVEKRNPLRLAQMPVEETFNASSRPESYG